MLPIDEACRILTAHRMRERVVGMDGPYRAEQLHLLVANHLGMEVRRRLHAHDRDQLHDVVLHDVAERTRLLVVRATTLDADLLSDGDLDVIDVLPVPQRLEDPVREAEDEQVLHGLLAEVVVDAVDLLLDEGRVQPLVELAGGCQVAPKRLLDDHAHEGPGCLCRQTRGIESIGEGRHRIRWRAEVEEAIARGAAFAVRGLERPLERLESVRGVHVEGRVSQSRGKRFPRISAQMDPAVLLDALAHVGAEFLVGHLAATCADDGEARGHGSFRGERIQRRDELALGQVAAGSEDDDAEGNRCARLPAPLVQRALRDQCDAAAPAAASAFTGCPPNSLRSAAITLLPNPSGRRDWYRDISDNASTGAGTESCIASSRVQRPSPESSTKPRSWSSCGSRSNAFSSSSRSHERTTLPWFQRCAIACRSSCGKALLAWRTLKPSAYASSIPYSMP